MLNSLIKWMGIVIPSIHYRTYYAYALNIKFTETINMKNIVAIFWLLVGGACLGMAAYMNYKGVTNWGWFLFAGLAILASITLKDNITINEEDEEDSQHD